MPPKKGKKGDKKGKKGGKSADEPVEEKPPTPEPTEKEILLQKELADLTEELEEVKSQVEDLRKDNEWLQQEANKVRIESHEYMSYMEKKTSKRQSTIISLSDQNQKEIQDIKEEKKKMLEEFAKKKQALRAILLEKESQLDNTRKELDQLQELKNLQKEQMTRIKELEKEVMQMRGKHSDAIQQLKARFLKEKKEYHKDAETRKETMAKQANKEAMQCLTDHTQNIKVDNRKLRHELLLLIRKTRALHEHKHHLEEQKTQLLMEQQFAEDLKTLRSARQHKVLKSFGMLEDSHDQQELSETD